LHHEAITERFGGGGEALQGQLSSGKFLSQSLHSVAALRTPGKLSPDVRM